MNEFEKNIPLTTVQWVGTLILLLIPLVNVIMIFVWAFGKGKVGRKNFSSAVIVLVVMMILATLLAWWLLGFSPTQLFNMQPLDFMF